MKSDVTKEQIKHILDTQHQADMGYFLECIIKRMAGVNQLQPFLNHPNYAELLRKSGLNHPLAQELHETTKKLVEEINKKYPPSQSS